MKRLLIAAALVLLSGEVRAWEVTSGSELHGLCSVPQPAAACTGYIIAVIETWAAASAARPRIYRAWCLEQSPGVVLRDLIDLVVIHLRDHPERRHEPAVVLIVELLGDTFPCR